MKQIIAFILAFLLIVLTPAQAFASTLYFPHTDHQGSVVMVSDESGEVVSDYRYFAYGEDKYSQEEATPSATERKYTSQIKDEETDVYYYNARYYDPLIGSFLSADFLGNQINRYVYVAGDPINRIDPTGNRLDELGQPVSGPANNIQIGSPIDLGIPLGPPGGFVLTIPADSSLLTSYTQITISNPYQVLSDLQTQAAFNSNFYHVPNAVNQDIYAQDALWRPIGLFGTGGNVVDYGPADTPLDLYALVVDEHNNFSVAQNLYGTDYYRYLSSGELVDPGSLTFAVTGARLVGKDPRTGEDLPLPGDSKYADTFIHRVGIGISPETNELIVIAAHTTLANFQKAFTELSVTEAIYFDSGGSASLAIFENNLPNLIWGDRWNTEGNALNGFGRGTPATVGILPNANVRVSPITP